MKGCKPCFITSVYRGVRAGSVVARGLAAPVEVVRRDCYLLYYARRGKNCNWSTVIVQATDHSIMMAWFLY